MAAGNLDGQQAIYGINVTPLVDIMLVLLITFMLTAVIDVPAAANAVTVNLPRASSGTEPPPATLAITIGAQGQIRVDGVEVSLGQLSDRATRARAASDGAQAVVAADRAVAYDRVVGVVDAVRKAGIVELALSVEEKR